MSDFGPHSSERRHPVDVAGLVAAGESGNDSRSQGDIAKSEITARRVDKEEYDRALKMVQDFRNSVERLEKYDLSDSNFRKEKVEELKNKIMTLKEEAAKRPSKDDIEEKMKELRRKYGRKLRLDVKNIADKYTDPSEDFDPFEDCNDEQEVKVKRWYRITGKQSIERLEPLLHNRFTHLGPWGSVDEGSQQDSDGEDKCLDLVWETTCEQTWRTRHNLATVLNRLHNTQILEDKSNLAFLQQKISR